MLLPRFRSELGLICQTWPKGRLHRATGMGRRDPDIVDRVSCHLMCVSHMDACELISCSGTSFSCSHNEQGQHVIHGPAPAAAAAADIDKHAVVRRGSSEQSSHSMINAPKRRCVVALLTVLW